MSLIRKYSDIANPERLQSGTFSETTVLKGLKTANNKFSIFRSLENANLGSFWFRHSGKVSVPEFRKSPNPEGRQKRQSRRVPVSPNRKGPYREGSGKRQPGKITNPSFLNGSIFADSEEYSKTTIEQDCQLEKSESFSMRKGLKKTN